MLTLHRTFLLISLWLTVTWCQNVDSCPGYKATNVVSTDSTLTADLNLNGPACNVYGTDLTNLRLNVEYQTGGYKEIRYYAFDTDFPC
jgi:alpha-glucosidase